MVRRCERGLAGRRCLHHRCIRSIDRRKAVLVSHRTPLHRPRRMSARPCHLAVDSAACRGRRCGLPVSMSRCRCPKDRRAQCRILLRRAPPYQAMAGCPPSSEQRPFRSQRPICPIRVGKPWCPRLQADPQLPWLPPRFPIRRNRMGRTMRNPLREGFPAFGRPREPRPPPIRRASRHSDEAGVAFVDD